MMPVYSPQQTWGVPFNPKKTLFTLRKPMFIENFTRRPKVGLYL